MADVNCQCGVQVGYRFMADKSSTNHNYHQVGRCGFVLSRVKVDKSRAGGNPGLIFVAPN